MHALCAVLVYESGQRHLLMRACSNPPARQLRGAGQAHSATQRRARGAATPARSASHHLHSRRARRQPQAHEAEPHAHGRHAQATTWGLCCCRHAHGRGVHVQCRGAQAGGSTHRRRDQGVPPYPRMLPDAPCTHPGCFHCRRPGCAPQRCDAASRHRRGWWARLDCPNLHVSQPAPVYTTAVARSLVHSISLPACPTELLASLYPAADSQRPLVRTMQRLTSRLDGRTRVSQAYQLPVGGLGRRPARRSVFRRTAASAHSGRPSTPASSTHDAKRMPVSVQA